MDRSKGEIQRLSNVSEWYSSRKGLDSKLIRYRAKTLLPYFKGSKVLELGCADGLMTEMLVTHFKRVVAVDGSSKFCDEVRSRIKTDNLEVVCSLFEDFEVNEKFDTIIMAHILEHIENPVQMLKLANNWLKDNGVILIDVPTANSIHRQAGVKMGLLKRVDELNELDKKLGHRRVYTWETLQGDLKSAGLKIKEMGGIFLKTLTNSQIDKWWTEEMMNAFYELGKEYPEIAAEIYAVCEK
jgi:2-polyprenyl-3-methyl-5-hydroxy-6-metoxy-1,4-benzoquinol methylase